MGKKHIKKIGLVMAKKKAMVKVIYVHRKQNEAKNVNKPIPNYRDLSKTRLNQQPWIKPRRNQQLEELRKFILRGIKVDDYGISYTHHDEILNWETFLQDDSLKFNKRMNKKLQKNVAINEFEILERLGKGGFGEVRLVLLKKIETYLAAKIIKRDRLKSKGLYQLKMEKNILKGIFFPFTVHLEFYLEDPISLYLIMPVLLGGDLFSLLQRLYKLSETAAVFYSSQMVLTFEYLHYFNILYRDLKPENILIDHLGYLKLTDFGLSKFVITRTYTLTGTPEYLAPEMIEHKGYSVSADWWSLGVLIYELCCGYSPFLSDDRSITFSKIIKGNYHLPATFSEDLCDIIKNLLVVDVTKRYGNMKNGVNDIKSHRWFNSINWLSLVNRQLVPPYKPQLHSVCDTKYFKDQYEDMKQMYNF